MLSLYFCYAFIVQDDRDKDEDEKEEIVPWDNIKSIYSSGDNRDSEDEINIELASKEKCGKLFLASEETVDKLATFDENFSFEWEKIMKNKGTEMRQNLVKESVELVFDYGANDNDTLNVQKIHLT
ncbi:hypothetical protein V6N13_110596 [Hibiscus sabdariffa]|uniref:Uncharacterized protein n=1 Tax=Hibiscus sabdariffa TaxID=183260 RepID=A0ABR2THR5_9ROSI